MHLCIGLLFMFNLVIILTIQLYLLMKHVLVEDFVQTYFSVTSYMIAGDVDPRSLEGKTVALEPKKKRKPSKQAKIDKNCKLDFSKKEDAEIPASKKRKSEDDDNELACPPAKRRKLNKDVIVVTSDSEQQAIRKPLSLPKFLSSSSSDGLSSSSEDESDGSVLI